MSDKKFEVASIEHEGKRINVVFVDKTLAENTLQEPIRSYLEAAANNSGLPGEAAFAWYHNIDGAVFGVFSPPHWNTYFDNTTYETLVGQINETLTIDINDLMASV